MDTSNREARLAVHDSLARFNRWRLDLALYSARGDRAPTEAQRVEMLARCTAIQREILDARTDLVAGLADAPPRIAGHSRVVDVKRALDNIEGALDDVRDKLCG